jgi:hypothetical protein
MATEFESKYGELIECKITTAVSLEYFIQRHQIAPVKATRLNLLLGDMLLDESNGICFACDLELEPHNIDKSLGQYRHRKCPPIAFKTFKFKMR